MSDLEEKNTSLAPQKDRGILYLNDKKFAVGLTWLTTDVDANASLLKKRIERLEADYYCVRNTIASQHGFGFITLGHRMNMMAAASIAGDMLVGNWHGIFTADNGWWYLAVHSDNIAPGGDRFFFSEEQAYSYFTEQAGLYNWPRSYAPATWNIEDANPEIPLQKLLEDVTQAPVLKSANLDAIFGGRKRRNFALFVTILGFISLFSAAILPTMISKEREKKELAARPEILAPAVIKPPPKVEDVQLSSFSGTLKLPKPSVILQFCNIGFSKAIEPLPGWTMESVSCNVLQDGKIVQTQAQWRKKVGSFELIKPTLSKFDPNVQVSFNGNDVLQAVHVSKTLQNISFPLQQVLTREEQIRVLYERFGNLGKMELSDVVPPPPDTNIQTNVTRFAGEEEILQRPSYLRMVISTRTPPKILAPYFDVPGL
ncbi:MAG: type 4b pilus protein PilO2, partial [Pseudomonadota bacterium]